MGNEESRDLRVKGKSIEKKSEKRKKNISDM